MPSNYFNDEQRKLNLDIIKKDIEKNPHSKPLSTNRLSVKDGQNDLEIAFLSTFLKTQENYDNESSTLAYLLDEKGFTDPTILPDEPSHTQRQTALTLIQWLGTTVGKGFLDEALAQAGLQITKIPKK